MPVGSQLLTDLATSLVEFFWPSSNLVIDCWKWSASLLLLVICTSCLTVGSFSYFPTGLPHSDVYVCVHLLEMVHEASHILQTWYKILCSSGILSSGMTRRSTSLGRILELLVKIEHRTVNFSWRIVHAQSHRTWGHRVSDENHIDKLLALFAL